MARLRLLLVSDAHGSEKAARRLRSVERDVTVVAGDLADCGGTVEEAHAVLEELASHGPPVVWVPGNCDTPSLLEAPVPRNTRLLHGACVRVEGVCFAGAGGGTYSPFSTPFEMSDEELGEVLGKALEGAPRELVVVTHVPGYETGLDLTYSGLHVGSRSVRSLVERVNPLIHVCGHIHEAWGVARVGATMSVNPGPLFQGRYAVAVLDTSKNMVTARLLSL